MIFGIGNDIIEVHRIKKSIMRHGKHFLDKLFTINEQIYCEKYSDPTVHYAGRFAAKEAIVKALGTGITSKISWLDIEILNDFQGKPCVNLSVKVAKNYNVGSVNISISHCKDYATAFCVITKTDNV